MILNYILLQAASGLSNLIMPLLMISVVWFFFLRPQKNKLNEEKTFRESLKKGDEIVTQSGMIGQIVNIGDGVITLQIGNKGTVKILQSAVSKELTDSYNK